MLLRYGLITLIAIMPILDLAPELINSIFDYVSVADLKHRIDILLVSRKWYNTIHPIFLSSIQLHELYLSAHDLEVFPPVGSPLLNLMQESTTLLDVQLLGHPSKESGKRPESQEEAGEHYFCDETYGWFRDGRSWAVAEPTHTWTDGREQYVWDGKVRHQLRKWAANVNDSLKKLGDKSLSKFERLEMVSFRATSEDQDQVGPRWDYISDHALQNLVLNLPSQLTTLTLDTCGSEILARDGTSAPLHMCPLIATRMQDLKMLRVRMRHICAELLNVQSSFGGVSKLESLVIKLNIPAFPHKPTQDRANYNKCYDVEWCQSMMEDQKKKDLPREMIKASRTLARSSHTLKLLRVSFRGPKHSTINLIAVDCLTRRYLWVPEELFAYEDHGLSWDAWEEDDEMLMVGHWYQHAGFD